ncbi:flagellar protein FlbB [Bradyrhizobium macuxiense]|uniref:Flagellar protein FlbB n=1 Tax=Bradyrhizobium macuxiense TaxID=1755647 RepID=A0A125Q615_9BRAD|nr:flagellar protein FlbB [Bradyrhizobium macuxiense]KWV46490.1 flagellar protein FlbB [Bradyrhizobium macuxiense]
MKSFRDIRVMPVVLTAVFGLMVLKVAGLVLDGGYVFDYTPQPTGPSWAQENFNFPGGNKAAVDDRARIDSGDVTGSVENKETKKDEAPKPAAPAATPPKPDGVAVNMDQTAPPVSATERAILERLQARRQELDQRAREVEIRESLLKAAEKRIESKVEEAKANDAKASADAAAKAEAEAARFKGIITMYENMKPKDAAKVFDRLDMNVLYQIASQIQPRKMSDILGQMQPEAAERLTVELARRASGDNSAAADDLPKIEGTLLTPKTN